MTTGSDIYGPQAPRVEDVWRAQDAALEASARGSDAEYQQLATACRQTEAAYLDAYDRDLLRDLEAGAPEPEAEAAPRTSPPPARSSPPSSPAAPRPGPPRSPSARVTG